MRFRFFTCTYLGAITKAKKKLGHSAFAIVPIYGYKVYTYIFDIILTPFFWQIVNKRTLEMLRI